MGVGSAGGKKEEKVEPALGTAGPVVLHGTQAAGVKADPGFGGPGLGLLPSQPAPSTPAFSGAAGAASGEPGVSPDPNPSSEWAPGSASQEADMGDAEEEGGGWTGWSGWTGEDGE